MKIEQERKEFLKQELETAASGNDDKAAFAKTALELFARGETFGGILNFGLMKTVKGWEKEQGNCGIVFELILYGLFHPDDLLPDQKKWQDEIRNCYNRVADEETKTSINDFIKAIETVGKMLQIQGKVFESQKSLNGTLSRNLSKTTKDFKAVKRTLEITIEENIKLKNKQSGRQKVSQKLAAEICNRDVRTIKNWDKWIGRPKWYVGRDITVTEFKERYHAGQAEERMQKAVRKGLKNPVRLKTN